MIMVFECCLNGTPKKTMDMQFRFLCFCGLMLLPVSVAGGDTAVQFVPAFGDSKIVQGMELIAKFDFEDAPVDGFFIGAGAKAMVNGTAAYGIGPGGSKTARLSSDFWLEVTKEDDGPLLAGLSEFTVSYDSNPSANAANNGSVFYAARTIRSSKINWARFLNVIDKTGSIEVQRYYNTGTRALGPRAARSDGWRHLDIVFSKASTKIYIDGVLKVTQPSDYPIEQVLSETGGFLYIGKSNAEANLFFLGEIANFKIWKPADPDNAGKVAVARETLTLPYGLDKNHVYGNITLPKTALYGTTLTWKTNRPDIVDVNEYAIPDYAPRLAGTVTRPTGADVIVTMTATISFRSVSDTKEFTFTVKKAPQIPTSLLETEAYLLVHFTGEGNATGEQVYFALSKDAKKWEDTRRDGNPILRSTIGDRGLRDPWIIRSPEGDKFYLLATDLSVNQRGGWDWKASSTNLAVWESHDLVNWGEMRLVDVAGSIHDAGSAWAPECVYDEITGDYFVYWATLSHRSANGNTGSMIYSARTRDFHSFTKPTLWIDTNDIIDTTVVKAADGHWYRATQTKTIRIDKSVDTVTVNGKTYPSLTGGWETTGTLQHIFEGAWRYGSSAEGPELFLYNKKDWLMADGVLSPTYGLYVDPPRYGYMPFYTTDIGAITRPPWFAGTGIDMGSLKKRHGGIMTITLDEYNAIMKGLAIP